MEDAINEAMFDFAKVIQSLIGRGWVLGDINYGERRLGIGPSITLSKGESSVKCFSSHDVERVLSDDFDKEWKK